MGTKAQAVTDQPSIICVKTVIGQGSPHKAGTAGVHGAALGEEELQLTKEGYGLPHPSEKFQISDAITAHWSDIIKPPIPIFTLGESKDLATRKFSEGCIN